MNHHPALTATPSEPSPPSRPRIKLVSRWLWITYVIGGGGLLPMGAVFWQTHLDGQITHVEELGWARDVQWLGASKDHWLLRTPSGVLLTLESHQQGWAMDPDVRLLRKTTANGRRWVCDASLSHCIPTADEKHTLKGGAAS